jgi:hypothetical protein
MLIDWAKVNWTIITETDIDESLKKKMNAKELGKILVALGVTPTENLRSAIFLRKLINAKKEFMIYAADPHKGSNDMCPLRTALSSNNLLNELAKMLDLYLELSISVDNNEAESNEKYNIYSDYFDKKLFRGNFKDNVDLFLTKHKLAAHALNMLTQNFINNIKQTCDRIIGDIDKINNLFNDVYPGGKISELIEIKSTGSDFHKGGKQVLILSFKTTQIPKFKLVYKPGDIEIDCLLIGDSSVVNHLTPNFMELSLVEIINDRIDKELKLDPESSLVKLRTLHILPRNPTSNCEPGPSLPERAIGDSYGYIEYIERDDPITNDKENIVKKFYRSMGQWAAIACIFSFTDLHAENVLVKEHEPVLIDMEVSLIKIVEHIFDTNLCIDVGGITGQIRITQNSRLKVDESGKYFEVDVEEKVETQNRLYESYESGAKVINVNWIYLLYGFQSGMNLLSKIISETNFFRWMDRLNNVLVRFVPISTNEFGKTLRGHYRGAPTKNDQGEDLTTEGSMKDLLKIKWDYYLKIYNQDMKEALKEKEKTGIDKSRFINPRFIIWQDSIVGVDFRNMDIPVFYNRIGYADIIDSRGRINNTNIDATKNRVSYFDSPPISIIKERINDLRDKKRFDELRANYFVDWRKEYTKDRFP